MSTPEQVAVDWLKLAATTTAKVSAVVRHHGHLLHSRVKREANQPRTNLRPSSSPEGPRLMLGDYNRSIVLDVARTGASTVANVGTNKVQGPRLEFGHAARRWAYDFGPRSAPRRARAFARGWAGQIGRGRHGASFGGVFPVLPESGAAERGLHHANPLNRGAACGTD